MSGHEAPDTADKGIRFGDGDLLLDTIVEETTGDEGAGGGELIEATIFFTDSRDRNYAIQIRKGSDSDYELGADDPQDHSTQGLVVSSIDPRLVIQVLSLSTEEILGLATVIPAE